MDGPQPASHDSVKVIVRVRPFTEDEVRDSRGMLQPTVFPHSSALLSCVSLVNPTLRNVFPFDRVAWSVPPEQFRCDAVPFASQEAVFDEVGLPTVSSSLQGYNGCIFAYGQTSSGKTYTMMGWDGDEGIIPRLSRELFARIRGSSATGTAAPKADCRVTVSFLEIYMENVSDLTVPKAGADIQSLSVHHDPTLGPIVKGLKHTPVSCWDDVKRILHLGNRQKAIRATAMNERSSRSHVVVQLTINQTEVVGCVGRKEVCKNRRSRLNLIDLAGSEKILKSKVEGRGIQEATNINKSLTTLGRVIDALIDSSRTHVPYRDSILTTLLSDSLGGNSRTYMVACLSPAQRNYEETLSTLRYAVRTRNVVNLVKVNEDAASALIHELQEEIKMLRSGSVARPVQDPREVEELQLRLRRTEEMVHELRVREQEERATVMRREEQWELRRTELQVQHREQLVALEAEAQQLEQFQAVLRLKTEELQEEKEGNRRRAVLRRFQLAARAALQQHRANTAKNESATIQTQATLMTGHATSVGQRFEEVLHSIVDEGPRCDLCHVAPCLYLCYDCSERYCNPCDAKVHRNHPTHKRYPCINGEVQKIHQPCDMCLVAEGKFLCRGCGNVALCDPCDQLKHRNPKRAGHQRTMLSTAPGSPLQRAPGTPSHGPSVLPLPSSHPLLQLPKSIFPPTSSLPVDTMSTVGQTMVRRFSSGEQNALPPTPMRTPKQRARSLPDQMPLPFPLKVSAMPQRTIVPKSGGHDLVRTGSEGKSATAPCAIAVVGTSTADSRRRGRDVAAIQEFGGVLYQTIP